MAARKTIRRTARATGPVAAELPRKLFLAGLGAVSIARKRGEALLDTLATEGESFKASTERYVARVKRDATRAGTQLRREISRKIAPLQRRATAAVQSFDATVGRDVRRALGNLRVPTRADVAELLGKARGRKTRVKATRRNRAA